MTLEDRCEEIMRLIDGALDPTSVRPAAAGRRRGQRDPALVVVPVPATTRRSTRPRPTGEQ